MLFFHLLVHNLYNGGIIAHAYKLNKWLFSSIFANCACVASFPVDIFFYNFSLFSVVVFKQCKKCLVINKCAKCLNVFLCVSGEGFWAAGGFVGALGDAAAAFPTGVPGATLRRNRLVRRRAFARLFLRRPQVGQRGNKS